MDIIFETIEAQNFKSIGEAVSINYTDFSGLNFVIGVNLDQPGSKNGSGKTTLLVDCLVFALFGRTIKQTANQYIPNRNCNKKLESYVKLTFKANGIRYRSECYCNKSSLKMQLYIEDSNEENGWKDITQASIIKTKQYIQDEILKCNFDLFKSTIIIAAADCLNFYEGMSKSQKRSYIENIFNLNCFGYMFDSIKSDLNNTKKEISFANSEIIKETQQLNNISEKLNQYKQTIESKSNELKKLIVENVATYKEKNLEKEKLETQLKNSSDIQLKYDELISKESNLIQQQQKIEREIYKAETKIESINTLINEITSIKTGLCSVCSEVINTKYNYNKQIKGIEALNKLISEDNKKIESYKTELIDIKQEKTNIESEIKKYSNIEFNIRSLSIELSNIKSNLQTMKKDFQESQNNTNPFEDLYKKTESILLNAQNKLNDLNVNYKHLDILKTICSETGVKQYIIKDIVVLLNSLIQKYLNEIGAEYLVYFDESFDFKFMTINGECEYYSFSAGERQRIQIATLLAFRDLILNGKINSNILIIDEVLDMAIDALAIKRIISILQRKTIDANQALFIISHRSEITDENIFNHIIEVKKENGISSINII